MRSPQLAWLGAGPLLVGAAGDEDMQQLTMACAIVVAAMSAAALDGSTAQEVCAKRTCVVVGPGRHASCEIGGQIAHDVVTCRTGKEPSAPAFVNLAGGSVGFQIGGPAPFPLDTQFVTSFRASQKLAGIGLSSTVVSSGAVAREASFGGTVTIQHVLSGSVVTPAAARPFTIATAHMLRLAA